MVLIIFSTLSVLTDEHIAGLDGLYDKISASAAQHYVVGNYASSLLTFKSKGAIMFGLILKFGNLALVIMVRALFAAWKILLTRALGHCFLAKVLCLGSPAHGSRL